MKLGLLGYGNLARALDGGIAKEHLLPADSIYVFDSSSAACAAARVAGHGVAQNIKELFDISDVIVLLIKPAVFRTLSHDFTSLKTDGKRVISCMAAVHTDEIKKAFRCPVMRVMATLAAADASDIIGHTPNEDFANIVRILRGLGDTLCLDEDMLDRLTVASSCGLGFAAHIMNAYMEECIKYGFSPSQSEAIARRIFTYAAFHKSFAELATQVATKGGATEAGIIALDEPLCAALSAAFEDAGKKAIPDIT